jgi:hypothetical protein
MEATGYSRWFDGTESLRAEIGLGLPGTVQDLPGACGEQSAYTRADESEGRRQNAFAFVASTDDDGGRTVVDGDAETEASTRSNRRADERMAATMAISLDGNALNGLAAEGLVSARGMNDKSVVAHGLQVTLVGPAVGCRGSSAGPWGVLHNPPY